jgi:hypothetical protein
MVIKIRTSLGFAQLTDGNLSPFTGGVIEGLTENAASFPDLPVAVKPLGVFKDTFDQALIDMVSAGKSATAAKDEARDALVEGLRKDAFYVAAAANNNLAVLLSSGYEAVSTNRTQTALPQTEVSSVKTPNSGTIQAKVKPQANVRSYEGRIKTADGEYGPTISFASSKKILFEDLKAGLTYTLQLRAIGGTTGSSDWSDPVTKMAI